MVAAGAGATVGSFMEEPSPSEMGPRPLGMVKPLRSWMVSPRVRRPRVVVMGSCPIGVAWEVPGGEWRRMVGAVLPRTGGRAVEFGVRVGFAAAPGMASREGSGAMVPALITTGRLRCFDSCHLSPP